MTVIFDTEEKARTGIHCFMEKIKELAKVKGISITPDITFDIAFRKVVLGGYKENLSSEFIEECNYLFTECFKSIGLYNIN